MKLRRLQMRSKTDWEPAI